MLTEFESYLADPAIAFTNWDIRLRAFFNYLAKYPSIKDVPSGLMPHKLFGDFEKREAIRLIPIAKRKDESVRKITAAAIAEFASEEAIAAGLIPPPDYGLTRTELLAKFLKFPIDQQREILNEKWDLVRGPEMIPILEQLATGPLAQPALERLFSLDADKAAKILRADIATPSPRLATLALKALPAQSIPEADEFLRPQIETNLPLVARFASETLAAPMATAYAVPNQACAAEENFLSYFLRTQPATGLRLLTAAMNNRERRGCHHMHLGRLAFLNWTPPINAQAKLYLNDPDPETVIDAARVLSSHGEPDAQPLLWKRLEEWSAKWNGRSAELKAHPVTGDNPNVWDRNLGDALFTSLASAKAWRLNESGRARLASLCIDEDCHRRWPAKQEPGPIMIDVANGGAIYPPAFRVEGYAAPTFPGLLTKLKQYDSDTHFAWCPQSSNSFTKGEIAAMLAELQAAFPERIEPCKVVN